MKTRIISLFLLSAMTVSCTKDLDIEYHDIEPIPVIEANLTDRGLDVRLTLTSPMNEPMNTVAQTDYTATLNEKETDTYRLDVDYHGKHFFSECKMQPKAEIGDVKFQWIKMPYDHVAVMSIWLVDDPQTPGECWWVRVWRNGKIYRWLYNDDKFALNGMVEITAMTSRRNPKPDDEDTLTDGDELRISATRVPRHIFNYLSNLAAHTIAGPTTFGGDFCLGYFLASIPTDTTVIYRPAEF